MFGPVASVAVVFLLAAFFAGFSLHMRRRPKLYRAIFSVPHGSRYASFSLRWLPRVFALLSVILVLVGLASAFVFVLD